MKRFLLFILILSTSFTTSIAQTVTWNGSGDGISWNDSNNWDTASVPTAVNDVIIPDGSTPTVNVASSVKSIDVQGTSTLSITRNFTFTNASNIAANSIVNWSNQALLGGGTLTNQGTLNLTTGQTHVILGGTTLINEGTLNILSTGDLFITDGFVNNMSTGVIDLQEVSGSIRFQNATTTPHILNNAGLIKRTTNSGTALITVDITNSGIIDVEIGELRFSDSDNGGVEFTNDVDGIVKGIATINLSGTFTNNGTYSPGASPGTLTVIGDYTSTSTSVLDVELNGLTQSSEYDLLAITGTNVVFDGSVNVTMGFEGNVNDEFIIATTTGTIMTCTLQSPTSASFGGNNYEFSVACRNNNEVVLTITGKTLGVEIFEFSEANILLFPNPTSSFITLKNNSNVDLLSAEIFDINGKIIQRIDLLGMTTNIDISLQNVSRGIYFIKINSNSRSITKKIVKL
jgi:Secretion system C-terminal sorting domain